MPLISDGMRTDAELITEFLLGQLDEEASRALEDRMFADDEFFLAIQMKEDDLINAYLRERLSPVQKRHFETHFLASPRHRARLETARALDEYVDRETRANAAVWPQATIWDKLKSFFVMPRIALAACAVVVLLVTFGIWFQAHRPLETARGPQAQPAKRTESANAGQETNRKEGPKNGNTAEVPRPEPARPRTFVSLALLPGALRGNDQQTLVIAADVERVQLLLESTYELAAGKYTVTVRNASGAEVWKKNLSFARAQQPPLRVDVAPETLAPGAYMLSLARLGADVNSEPPLEYSFSVKEPGR
jgi:hypothetical protein